MTFVTVLLLVAGVGMVAALATGCNQVERARVNMEWDSMNEQRRAMACWGRDGGEQFGGSGVEGVSRDVLEKECPAGESQPIEQRRMMSPDTEAWMIETMKNGPEITPEDVGMSVEDAKLLCETYSVDDMAASMESDTSDYYVMPWNGTGYMLSSNMFHEIAQVSFDGLCASVAGN